jgi:hypothetical protein
MHNESRLIDLVHRSFRLIRFWRERSGTKEIEIERLKGVVGRLQKVAETQQGKINQLEFSKEYFENETKKLRSNSTHYAAQNELDLLRTIRTSQGQIITKLRKKLEELSTLYKESHTAWYEACKERDAASKRANAWRAEHDKVFTAWNNAVDGRDVAREGLAQARAEINTLYKEMDRIRKDLAVSQAVNRIISRPNQEGMENSRLEAMLEESYRNEFKRNIDNQKATDGANCPSS